MVVAGTKFCRSSWFRMPKSSSISVVNAVIEIEVSCTEASCLSAVTMTSSICRELSACAMPAKVTATARAEYFNNAPLGEGAIVVNGFPMNDASFFKSYFWSLHRLLLVIACAPSTIKATKLKVCKDTGTPENHPVVSRTG